MSIKAKAQAGEQTIVHANDNEPDKAAKFKKDFTFTRYCELGQTTKAKEFVIDGVMAAGESSYTVAKPDSGKSVITLDMDFHIAAGLDWHGYRVTKGLAVNFAFERYDLQLRRGMALRQHHSDAEPNIPLVVVGGKFDLHGNTLSVGRMVDLINYLQDDYQTVLRSATLDTLTKSFGRGKQNVAEDMKAYFDSVAHLLEKFPTAHCTIVHHEGHDTGRAKGAIDLDGLVDVSRRVVRKGDFFRLECDGANDGGASGTLLTYGMKSVEVTDADGNTFTAPVVFKAADTEKFAAALSVRAAETVKAKTKAELMDILTELSAGGHPVGGGMWQARYHEQYPEVNKNTVDSRFKRAIAELEEDGTVTPSGRPKVYVPAQVQT
ncbi:hypothetical protein ABIB00_007087 [Bradyrhizobium sp. LB14.3]|uniref:AAA family ATPase n=1 Tax=Bradyrhizobium sp. LB14.3 TaxID=3156328 RepID=UPI00339704CB